MKKMFLCMTAVLLLIGFAGCDLGLSGISGSALSGGDLAAAKAINRTETWKDGDGSYDFSSPNSESYHVEWTDSSDQNAVDFVMVVGIGWANGTSNRIVRYSGDFNPDVSNYYDDDGNWVGSDWQNAYLSLYGWAHNGSEIVEYYVLENYGEYYHGKPESGDTSYTTIGNTYTSNGSTYHIVTKMKNDYHGFGGDKTDFRQIVSIRDDRPRPGNVDGIITFSDHIAAWQAAGYGLNLDGYQILAVEANNSSGSATITVEECEAPSATPATTYQRYESEFSFGGEKYLSRTVATNFWQSGNGKLTNRVGWTNGSDGSSYWQAERIGSTNYYYIKNANDGKYLTLTLTTTDPNMLVSSMSPFYINLYMNPLFTDDMNAGGYGFRQHWVIATNSGGSETILKSRVNSDIAISLNETSGYAQGVPTSMLSSRALTINTRTFYERWNLEEYPDPNAPAIPTTVKNLSNKWSGKRLTVTSSNNDAETRAQTDNSSWASQNWIFENVAGTSAYRIRNTWSGRYLNVRDNSENAVVACYDLVSDWGSMQWIPEAAGDGGYRLKSVWSGKYLTIADTSDYSEVLAKDLHTDWASQVWYLVD